MLSGFLITRSYKADGALGRFLWHRALRIFPAFWACLLVTAFALAPVAFLRENGSLAGFLAAPNPPWLYVASNALLRTGLTNIAGLFAASPYHFEVNGSLWTLQYEFSCYLAVALFAVLGLLRKPQVVLPTAWGVFVLYAVVAWRIGQHEAPTLLAALELLAYFALGSVAYLFRRAIPIRPWVAIAAAAIAIASIPTTLHAVTLAPCLSYIALYAAMTLPIKSFDRRIDLSFGLYIYAFPIQQILTLFAVPTLGLPCYLLTTFALTLAFAAVSWMAIERPSLSLKTFRFGKQRPHAATTTS